MNGGGFPYSYVREVDIELLVFMPVYLSASGYYNEAGIGRRGGNKSY
jgi:hypothetical protein